MAFLTGREIKIYLLLVLVFTLAALIGTISFILLRDRPEIQREVSEKQFGPTGVESLDPSIEPIRQIEIPREFTQLYRKGWRPYRPVYDRWSWEQIEGYWIDPDELVRQELEVRTDRELEKFFKELPW